MLTRSQHPSGRGYVYFVEAVDTDSRRPCVMQIADTNTFTIDLYAQVVAWELTKEPSDRALKPTLSPSL